MKNLPISPREYELLKSNRDIILETAEQVMKDFGMMGHDIPFSGNPATACDELKDQIIPVLREMMDNQYEHFLSLLYRIDLSEKLIAEECHRCPNDSPAEIVSRLILERELMKVILRNYFRKKGSF